jgi:hypothetical protein
MDGAAIRALKPDNHIKCRRLARTVCAQQPDHFALLDVQTHAVNDAPPAIRFFEIRRDERRLRTNKRFIASPAAACGNNRRRRCFILYICDERAHGFWRMRCVEWTRPVDCAPRGSSDTTRFSRR